MRRTLLGNIALALVLTSACAAVQPAREVGKAAPTGEARASTSGTWIAPPEGSRELAVISDLHVGIGRRYETEDFRWDTELQGFLDALSVRGADHVDLVIAGDLLDLWQPPPDIRCVGPSPDLGCTVEQMRAITERVLAAHPRVPEALRRFTERGENRLYIIPGNHDSALLLAAVWQPLAQALGAERGRVNLATTGIWTSRDGRVLIEHGQQIGADVNRYANWPEITRSAEGKSYLIQPWGERFVQKLFNDQEVKYPLIDNLSPESAGIRYRMADRGLWGSASDMARFLVFNLFETSLAQKGGFLGEEAASEGEPNEALGRAQGHKLFVSALADDDPFRKELLADTQQSGALRAELDAVARDKERLSATEVLQLCDEAAAQGHPVCVEQTLGAGMERLVPRNYVLQQHLKERLSQYPRMRVFIYGHTHELEMRWEMKVNSMTNVYVLNSGAFKRVVDEKGYLARVRKQNLTPEEGLSQLDLDELPPCYSVVLMPESSVSALPQTLRWYMPAGSEGKFVPAGDMRCN